MLRELGLELVGLVHEFCEQSTSVAMGAFMAVGALGALPQKLRKLIMWGGAFKLQLCQLCNHVSGYQKAQAT